MNTAIPFREAMNVAGYLEVIEDAIAFPVSLAEARIHARIDDTTENDLVLDLIAAATQYVSDSVGANFATAKRFRQVVKSFYGGKIGLPPSTRSVESVKYYDAANVLQTVPDSVYRLIPGVPSWLELQTNQTWPTPATRSDAVQIECTVGTSVVPKPVKLAILMLVSHWFNHRGTTGGTAEIPHGVDALLNNSKIWSEGF